MKHKKQHWVPRSYLAAWCDPATPEGQTPYVWRFAKDGKSSKRKAPKNIFHETDLYTISLDDGRRELAVEQGLAELESEFVRIRNDVLATAKSLEGRDHMLLCAYVAAMQARSLPHLNHWKKQFQGALARMDEMRKSMRARPPEERAARRAYPPASSTTSASYEDFKTSVEGPVAQWVVFAIETQLPWLIQMRLRVLTTDDDVGFITSDRPCVWFDPEAYRLPWHLRSPGLAVSTIEITLPISPTQMLLLTHGTEGGGHVPVPRWQVDELNRRTRFHADEYFVVNRNETKRVWFKSGRPLRNAWRQHRRSKTLGRSAGA
ncbi:DUF4238 domain-containing protein [Candidatus Palauibacter polyketidifaciens]|uniref:DUF4238 domain-containing protein n=1 Tax=Candidatus Palauibacter polyketidifaciens TaxID=3056740 RepID=UPI00239AA309|nr:DUF4238 domain-containing protein [Candidatus Palauibacter polyketidifaciens]MDE2719285.1 DUF4238 domain-containing protein [Candidatus Palauibacter polyketidifaciens]